MIEKPLHQPPSDWECQEAVTRALRWRFRDHRSAERTPRLTDSAIQERLTGFPLPNAERARNAWWRVGTIVDQIADKEFDVLYKPGPPRALATSERNRPTYTEPTPPAVVPEGIQALYRSKWIRD